MLPLEAASWARRFRRHGAWRQMAGDAMLVAAHRLGVPPRILAARYFGRGIE